MFTSVSACRSVFTVRPQSVVLPTFKRSQFTLLAFASKVGRELISSRASKLNLLTDDGLRCSMLLAARRCHVAARVAVRCVSRACCGWSSLLASSVLRRRPWERAGERELPERESCVCCLAAAWLSHHMMLCPCVCRRVRVWGLRVNV